ncbi:hypothetical protein KR038_012007 [Drosophila bunnanda]|nr:hypothetical protein KR038_012007 [Drosophila bunnanda]
MNDIGNSVGLALRTSEVAFEAPFNHVLCKKLVIRNIDNARSVIFKVVPRSPRMFLVLPKNGFLEPNKEITVEILMETTDTKADEELPSVLLKVTHVLPPQNQGGNQIE